ncbi:MAG: hypothetical protein M0D55_08390 [Elusimicrobiota bacterium]|nr:MAG: hypothetical protein M0D55_08390 [Elusimicrobiota bacterium]
MLDPGRPWTVVDVSHDAEVVSRSQLVFVLADGRIAESGDPRELAARPDSVFSALFTELARQSRARAA